MRIADHFGAIKSRSMRGRVRILSTHPAADAAVDDGGDRIDPERIGAVFERQRRAPRQPDAGVIPRANVLVDAVFHANHALARVQQSGNPRLDAPLPLELAFALGDDDLESV